MRVKIANIATLLRLLCIIAVFAVLFIIDNTTRGLSSVLPFKTTESVLSSSSLASAQEIDQIKQTRDIKEQTKSYLALIKRVGPEDAQAALLQSGLPFDGQTHLLNHTVGDWLYDTYGVDGLRHCKDFFLSSCYHGFVISAVSDKGVAVLGSVMAKCWESGSNTAAQCSHAIGHGFLAYEGYKNMPTALQDCEALQETSEKFPVFNCIDGVFMENIFAVHEDGRPSPDRWVNPEDPFYPCNEPLFVENREYLKGCWQNQPMWMFQLFRGDVNRVGQECLKLEDQELQAICFNALSRQIHPLVGGSVKETFRLCNLQPAGWVDACIQSVVGAEVSVGGRDLPFALCNNLTGEKADACYEVLIVALKSYEPNEKDRHELCKKIVQSAWIKKCQDA